MQPVILLAKWVYSGTAKNCNLGHAIYGKSQADLENTREDLFFYRGEGGLAVINKSPLEETESLKYSGFSLAEL